MLSNKTASQISGMAEAEEEERMTPIGGETLLSQYKQCNAINDQALREAKNIKDLVSINVATVDKKLFVHQNNRRKRGDGGQQQHLESDQTTYNLHMDPVNFLQQQPAMVDREFLIKQSILNQSNKNHVSEAISRQQIQKQHHRTSHSHYQTQRIGSGPQTTKSSLGLQRLLPELPLGGISVKVPKKSLRSTKTAISSNNRTTSNKHSYQQQATTLERSGLPNQQDYEWDPVQISGRGSQIDPVRCLQNIFRKHDYKKRTPGVNQIAEKYKNMNLSQHKNSRKGSRMSTTHNTLMGQTYQDNGMSALSSFGGEGKRSIPATPNAIGVANFFSQQSNRASHNLGAANYRTGNILLHQENSNRSKLLPPATAPIGISRPELIQRGNKNQDIVDIVQFEQQRQSVNSGSIAQNAEAHNYQNIANKRKSMPKHTNFNVEEVLAANENSKTENLKLEQISAGDTASRNQLNSQRSHFKNQQQRKEQSKPNNSGVSPIVSDDLTQAQLAIREKLSKMKQLFDDEEERDKTREQNGMTRPESSEWDLHNHKLMYEEAMQKRQHHLELIEARQQSKGLAGETPAGFHQQNKDEKKRSKNFELGEEELREFLMNRITELKTADEQNDDDEHAGRFKFRASTISNVLPSGHVNEHSKLEASYKNRFQNKGDDLHKRMMKDQQRQIQKQTSSIRKIHSKVMEQQKKDLVSNRSKDARSHLNSGSDLGSSPVGTGTVHLNHVTRQNTNFSGDRYESSPRNLINSNLNLEQINTDLIEEQARHKVQSDGLSTQRDSIINGDEAIRPTRIMSPQVIQSEGADDEQASYELANPLINQQIKSGKQVFSEDGQYNAQLHQDNLGVNDAPEDLAIISQNYNIQASVIKKDDVPDQQAASKTAVVFYTEGAGLQPGEKVNIFSQVMRAIKQIDRQHAREAKERKLGVKKEALEILANAKAKNEMEEQRQSHKDDGWIDQSKQVDSPDCEDRDANEQIDDTDTEDELTIPPIDETKLRSSLQEALNKHAEKTGDKPGDVIIVQITDRSLSATDQEQLNVGSKASTGQEIIVQQRGKKVVHQKSRSHSRHSKGSRLNTAEMAETMGCHENYNMRPVVKPMDINDIYKIKAPATAPAIIIPEHGHYPQNQTEDQNEPFTVELSKTPAQLSVQSLKVDSDEAPQVIDAMGVEIGTVAKQMNTISNTDIDISRIHAADRDYDHDQHTYSGKFTDQESCYPSEAGDYENQERGHMPQQWQNGTLPTAPMTHALVTGSQMSYFCPKRFNRFPRFTIFFKKGQKHDAEGSYVHENTVSLNADFLKFLSDGRNVATTVGQVSTLHGSQVHGTQTTIHQGASLTAGEGTPDLTDAQKRTFSLADIDRAEQEAKKYLPKVPTDIEQWNAYLKQKKFDPFDRVVLVKGIDNSILTSFRTLKGENNTVSDTFKIVHKKFQPVKGKNAYFKSMVTRHVDKLPYHTNYRVSEIDEDEDFGAEYEVYEQNDDGSYDMIPDERKEQHKLNLNPAADIKANLDGRVESPPNSKLQHAMTAALIDFEKDAMTVSTNKKTSPDRRSPFKVLTTVDNSVPMNVILNHDLNSAQSVAAVQQKSRMPRPRPLNTNILAKGRGKARGDPKHSPDRLVMGSPFGVQGISPLTQLANTMLKEQQNTIHSPNLLPEDNSKKADNIKFAQLQANSQVSDSITQQNSIYKTEERPQNLSDMDPVKLQNQFNSTAAVEPHNQEDLSKQNDSEYLAQPAASKSQGIRVFDEQRAKSSITDGTLQRLESASKPVNVNTQKTRCVDKAVLRKTETQPGQDIKVHEQLLDTPYTPISLSHAKNSLLIEGQPGDTELLQQDGDGIGTANRDPSESEYAQVNGYAAAFNRDERVVAQGADILSQQAIETDSQAEYTGGANMLSQFSHKNNLVPPTVNVIKSVTQILQSQTASGSLDALDGGDTTKRTAAYVLESQRTMVENIDFQSGSPIVHQAFGGRKFPNKKHQDSVKLNLSYNYFVASQISSMKGGQQAKTGEATDRKRVKGALEPAKHVGVLTVPESLKAQHLGDEHALEKVAQPGARKGAVGHMIDKIYNKDRRMVNNAYKGNMLSTAVLTDMNRYHKLKSNTGVESRHYDKLWFQERIEEEKADVGLSLDCAPNKQAAQADSKSRTQLHNQRASQEATKDRKMGEQEILNSGQRLAGNFGEGLKPASADAIPGVVEGAVNYAEMVNRSETRTTLAKATYL